MSFTNHRKHSIVRSYRRSFRSKNTSQATESIQLIYHLDFRSKNIQSIYLISIPGPTTYHQPPISNLNFRSKNILPATESIQLISHLFFRSKNISPTTSTISWKMRRSWITPSDPKTPSSSRWTDLIWPWSCPPPRKKVCLCARAHSCVTDR